MGLFIVSTSGETRKMCNNITVDMYSIVGIDTRGKRIEPFIGIVYGKKEENDKPKECDPWVLRGETFPLIQAWRALRFFDRVSVLTPQILPDCWNAANRSYTNVSINQTFFNIENFVAVRKEILNSAPDESELDSMLYVAQLPGIVIDKNELIEELGRGIISISSRLRVLITNKIQ